ncbi:hypothetical protein DL897_04465 [Thermoflavimicrobium daqui]|jgi:hypothetical protein|uniref:Uncharacterized protein n=1 Tax=Thermoflavimicrobium daqui TaxID=2137476 RepID=A0A364K7P7_9BACL|nr:hypothetical protein DL897_04465 [Thermoflavimicrobium daqui]
MKGKVAEVFLAFSRLEDWGYIRIGYRTVTMIFEVIVERYFNGSMGYGFLYKKCRPIFSDGIFYLYKPII